MGFLNFIQSVDLSCVRFVREHIACAFLDVLMPIITLFGEDGIFWIAVTLALVLFKKTRRVGFVMALSMIMGLLVGNVTLKPLVARTRPYDVDVGVTLLIDRLSDYSFPSGHTLVSFETAVSLFLCGYKRMGAASLMLGFLVAFSRVYLYVHYPTDVIAGMVLGTAFAFVSYFVVNKIYAMGEKSKKM